MCDVYSQLLDNKEILRAYETDKSLKWYEYRLHILQNNQLKIAIQSAILMNTEQGQILFKKIVDTMSHITFDTMLIRHNKDKDYSITWSNLHKALNYKPKKITSLLSFELLMVCQKQKPRYDYKIQEQQAFLAHPNITEKLSFYEKTINLFKTLSTEKRPDFVCLIEQLLSPMNDATLMQHLFSDITIADEYKATVIHLLLTKKSSIPAKINTEILQLSHIYPVATISRKKQTPLDIAIESIENNINIPGDELFSLYQEFGEELKSSLTTEMQNKLSITIHLNH